MLCRQSPYCTGWQVPHEAGSSEASRGEKRSGAVPCGASGWRQWRCTNSRVSSRAIAGAASIARASAPATGETQDVTPTPYQHAAPRPHVGVSHATVQVVTTTMIRPTVVGWKAHTALRASRGVARVVSPLTASLYLEAGGAIIWLGERGGHCHPRALLGPVD